MAPKDQRSLAAEADSPSVRAAAIAAFTRLDLASAARLAVLGAFAAPADSLGAVSAGTPEAAEAGIGILRAGGNAIDATAGNGHDTVIGGTVNGTGSFVMVATKVGNDTVLSQIVHMVAQAQRSRAPSPRARGWRGRAAARGRARRLHRTR